MDIFKTRTYSVNDTPAIFQLSVMLPPGVIKLGFVESSRMGVSFWRLEEAVGSVGAVEAVAVGLGVSVAPSEDIEIGCGVGVSVMGGVVSGSVTGVAVVIRVGVAVDSSPCAIEELA